MRKLALQYLGYTNQEISDELSLLIDEISEEVKNDSNFKYIYMENTEILSFMTDSAYLEFLKNTSGYLLVATTLGPKIDQNIRLYANTDITKSVIYDAVASAYLEIKADEFEKNLGYSKLTYRFCPGYQGTNFLDNKIIAKVLNANKKIGISILDSGMIIPQKSMVGIIGIGKEVRKNCCGCILSSNCIYRSNGKVCYTVEGE